MTDNSVIKRFELTKDFLVAIPILASAVAVVFNVGYLYAVDINFFSFFTLSEHILFALEAVPLALLLSAMIIVGLLVADALMLKRAMKPEAERLTRI